MAISATLTGPASITAVPAVHGLPEAAAQNAGASIESSVSLLD